RAELQGRLPQHRDRVGELAFSDRDLAGRCLEGRALVLIPFLEGGLRPPLPELLRKRRELFADRGIERSRGRARLLPKEPSGDRSRDEGSAGRRGELHARITLPGRSESGSDHSALLRSRGLVLVEQPTSVESRFRRTRSSAVMRIDEARSRSTLRVRNDWP